MIAVAASGCATLEVSNADTAQLADTATTGVGIASGLQEANPIVAPLANGGPIGLLAMAGMKLGFNQLGRHQDPGTCREWLSISAAAGWGAATSNIAMLMAAPPLAVVALPIAIQSYRNNHKNQALEECYEGMIADAILRIPQDFRLEDSTEHMHEDLLQIVGFWPEPEIMKGTRPINNRKLVQIVAIDRFENLQRFISTHGLDWNILGFKERSGEDVLPLNTALLMPHLKDLHEIETSEEPIEEPIVRHGATLYASTGTVTICNRGRCIWTIEIGAQVASTSILKE